MQAMKGFGDKVRSAGAALCGRVTKGRARPPGSRRSAGRERAAAPALGLVALVLMSGCMSSSIERQRAARWKPAVDQRKVAPKSVAPAVAAVKAGADTQADRLRLAAGVLKRGDKLIITLSGIPTGTTESRVVIDDQGTISLPHFSRLKIEGMKVSEAARFIENTYIENAIFKQINVSIVTEEDLYYVQGEVERPGKYTKSGDLTLTQAIAAAGGPGQFAHPWKARIIRGREILPFNRKRINDGFDKDPLIQAGDIVEVGKGLWPW